IVSTPHGAAFGEKGSITERYVRYHEEKAKGGCGVVMMFGSSSIHPTSINDWGEVNNWDDGVIPQFREMSAAIHRHGALCLSQISHRGRRGHSWYSGTPLWAPSDTREERHREWPHVMTKAEIREVIDAWAAAAVTPSHYHPRGVFNDLAALTKSVVRVPVIVAGRIVTAEQAEAALAAGVCDLVGMTRALIADPEMPKKVGEGRLDDVRVCVG